MTNEHKSPIRNQSLMTSDQKSPFRKRCFMTSEQKSTIRKTFMTSERWYVSLEKAMNNWCSWKTIERFLKSNEDFKTYSQNIRPLLSEGNRMKQVSFSQHVHNRWRLEPGLKILWTMRYTLDTYPYKLMPPNCLCYCKH